MTDIFTKGKRSWIMARVKGRDTKPEIVVRSIIHQMGFRFSLNRQDLPGKPDIVLARYNKVVFVDGCFWHGHKKCPRSRHPSTRKKFWDKKLDDNIKRDKQLRSELKKNGWKVLVIWECEIKNIKNVQEKIGRFYMSRINTKQKKADPEKFRDEVEQLIRNFKVELRKGNLRRRVIALIPIFHSLRELGKSLIPKVFTSAARDRIQFYFQKYPKKIIKGDELLVISGIQEYARRVRELRVQFGWNIASGVTINKCTKMRMRNLLTI